MDIAVSAQIVTSYKIHFSQQKPHDLAGENSETALPRLPQLGWHFFKIDNRQRLAGGDLGSLGSQQGETEKAVHPQSN
jgi:hypothetical protein